MPDWMAAGRNMQKLSTWARWIVSLISTSVFIPIAVHLSKHWIEGTSLYDRPQETAGAVMNFITTAAQSPWVQGSALFFGAQSPWVQGSALFFGGLALGLWMDWLFRKFDGSRATNLSLLGYSMKELGIDIGNASAGYGFVWPDHIHMHRADLMALFIKLRNAGIAVPSSDVFKMRSGANILANYLHGVGTLLSEGHFKEAKAMALDALRVVEADIAANRNK